MLGDPVHQGDKAVGEGGIRAGALFTDSGDLSRLIGRPTTSVNEAVRAAL